MRATASRDDAVTQTLPAPAATPFAAPATGIERVHAARPGIDLNTDRPWTLGTQTAPSPTATPSAGAGQRDGDRWRGGPPASTRSTARRVESATQTAPAPTATPLSRPARWSPATRRAALELLGSAR